jgi:hypothetical protein
MAVKTNSAMRLLAILDKLKKCKSHTSVKDAIGITFAVDKEAAIGIHIGEIFWLANHTVKQITSLPDHEPEVHLKWCSTVYQGLSTLSVNGNINSFKDIYTDTARAYLEACSVELGRHFPDLEIENDKLRQIYDELSPLIEALLEDHVIEARLKAFIIEKLTLVQDIIGNSDVIGYSELITVTESAFAGTILRVGCFEKLQELKTNCKAFAAYIDKLGRLLILFEGAQIGYKGIEMVSSLLIK